jgi:hypothetical protein
METMKQMREQITREGKTLAHLATLQARGNVAPVVAGNACPRRTTCMVELSALRLYEGRGRTMIVPHGCNPFKTPNAKSQAAAPQAQVACTDGLGAVRPGKD